MIHLSVERHHELVHAQQERDTLRAQIEEAVAALRALRSVIFADDPDSDADDRTYYLDGRVIETIESCDTLGGFTLYATRAERERGRLGRFLHPSDCLRCWRFVHGWWRRIGSVHVDADSIGPPLLGR